MSTFDPDQPTTESAVVGEKKDDPDQLLLLGENGEYYAYSLSGDTAAVVEPDENWTVDETDNDELFG